MSKTLSSASVPQSLKLRRKTVSWFWIWEKFSHCSLRWSENNFIPQAGLQLMPIFLLCVKRKVNENPWYFLNILFRSIKIVWLLLLWLYNPRLNFAQTEDWLVKALVETSIYFIKEKNRIIILQMQSIYLKQI